MKNTTQQSRKGGKDQKSIQASITADQNTKWKKDKNKIKHHKQKPRDQPFPSR